MEDFAETHADEVWGVIDDVVAGGGSDDERFCISIGLIAKVVDDVGVGDVVLFEIANDFDVAGFDAAAAATVVGDAGGELALG